MTLKLNNYIIMVKRVLILLAILPLLFSFTGNKPINLFNGKNLKGWKVMNGTAEFKAQDGEIIGTTKIGSPNTFLVTEKKFTNFILEYEMKMDEGLNSGVQIRSNSIPSYQNGRVHGTQVEADDSKRAWSGGIYDEGRKGWRYPLEYNPKAKSAYVKGGWNSFKVVAYQNHIMTWINGVPAANLVEEDVETGFIGLQVHAIGNNQAMAGKEVHFKNISIKEINENDFAEVKTDAPQVSFLRNELTPEEKAEGWKLLFDGKTTDGWRGARLDHFPSKGWEIKDDALMVDKSGGKESANGGDIVTTGKFTNFVLIVDFKVTKGANGGVKYFVNTDLNKGEGSAIGCEFQVLDDENHPDAKLGVKGDRTVGSLYDLIPANQKIYNPDLPSVKLFNGIDNWNRAMIVVNGSKVQHFLNGCKVVEYERGTQMWRALVAYSKYRDWPNFGEAKSANLLLQDHGDQVFYRDIKIKELN